MITIFQPQITEKGDYTYLESRFIDESQGIDSIIWFKTTSEWKDYLCDAVIDPFLLLALIPAIKTNQNISVKGVVSNDLYFNINNSLLYLLKEIFKPNSEVQIDYSAPPIPLLLPCTPNGVGCGCSLGIDSLSAIKRYSSGTIPEEYRITHLTFFNVGALGEFDMDMAHAAYERTALRVNMFAEQIGLPLVKIDSNLSIIFNQVVNFSQSHIIRNASAVMALRLLFAKYYYASAFPLKNIKVSDCDLAYSETMLLPMLSSRTLCFFEGDGDKSRTDKTKYVANDELVQSNLYVCWRDIFSNGDKNFASSINNVQTLNCTRCDKCLRTLITLDILGQLQNYKNIFDLPYYYSIRNSYIEKILTDSGNLFYQEIRDLMHEYEFSIPAEVQHNIRRTRLRYSLLGKALRKITKTIK